MKDRAIKLINELLNSINNSKQLSENVLGTMMIKVVGVAIAFILNIVLARTLGVKDYGLYSYCNSWLMLLVVPASLGLERLIVRDLPRYSVNDDYGSLKGLLIRGSIASFFTGILITILSILVLSFFYEEDSFKFEVLFLFLLCIPFLALETVFQAAIRGLNKVWISLLSSHLIRPISYLLILFGVSLLYNDFPVLKVVQIYIGVYVLGALVTCWLLWINLPKEVFKIKAQFQETSKWIYTAIPFILITFSQVLNIRIGPILLGELGSTDLVGIYNVALKGSELIQFPINAINLSLAPVVASLYFAGKKDKLQLTVRKTARTIFFATVPISLLLMLGGYWYLQIFGKGFDSGLLALRLLCIAQIVNAAMGSVGVILGMTGYEKIMLRIVLASLFANTIFSYLLIPYFGVTGSAFAYLLNTIFWNVLMVYFVFKKVRINPMAFGKIISSGKIE